MKKHELIFRDYKNAILTGKYVYGSVLPTEKEIALQYGVSRVPVQQAMNSLKNAGFVQRSAGVGTTVIYKSNLRCVSECKTIFLLNQINPETAQITEGVQSVLHEMGIFVTVRYSYGDPSIERQVLQQLLKGKIEGLLMYGSNSDLNIDLIYELVIQGKALVFVDNLPNNIVCNCVMSDPASAMHKIVEHLYEKGHRKIGVVTHPLEKRSAANLRFKLLKIAFDYFNLNLPDEYCTELTEPTIDIPKIMGLPDPPTALIFTASVLASGCAKVFENLGLKIPGDLSIVVHDKIERFFEPYHLNLTCVGQNYFDIGKLAATRLYEYMVLPDHKFRVEYIPTTFHKGDSVAKL